MSDKDHRAVLRASPPDLSLRNRIVQTTVDHTTYRRLYGLAKAKDISLRALIRETLEHLVGVR